ncbi:MAG: DNA oxidative demethylase AlkB [Gammaproteobacteria bacterium]|nr:MAG: DNA oxidative demethylase AlkB [Gammaproteobacteria bacterium]
MAAEPDTPLDLFADGDAQPRRETLGPGAVLLRSFASARAGALLAALEEVVQRSPFRFMTTPGGYRMSVAMTNCGAAGWVTDRSGYRYDALDPLSAACWPLMPPVFRELAAQAAGAAGFAEFEPDACLINRYQPGARLSLHQDKDERDLSSPIVSVSLGLPAVFLFGAHRRAERPRRVPLAHGDVVVWGGPARLRFHGVQPLKEGRHPDLGACRVNLSFRKAR